MQDLHPIKGTWGPLVLFLGGFSSLTESEGEGMFGALGYLISSFIYLPVALGKRHMTGTMMLM